MKYAKSGEADGEVTIAEKFLERFILPSNADLV
jgi:hypothetical protein